MAMNWMHRARSEPDHRFTWVAEQFKCLAYTVEMPFKDNANLPDEQFGWSDVRSMKLGQDTLIAIRAVVEKL